MKVDIDDKISFVFDGMFDLTSVKELVERFEEFREQMIRGYIFEAYNVRNMRKLVGTLLLLYLLDLNASRLIRMKVEGDEHGGFHMPLYVGTPPIEVTNITLDTGSTLTIFPCTTCLKCNGGEENLYDPEASFTNSKTKCVSLYTSIEFSLIHL